MLLTANDDEGYKGGTLSTGYLEESSHTYSSGWVESVHDTLEM